MGLELNSKLDNLLPLIKCLLQEGLSVFPHVQGKRGKYSVSDRGSRNSGREDHCYLERGSGGGKVGETREEGGG